MISQKKYQCTVWVNCITYNHAPYIWDAMNGFCMQQTDFPFVCTIVDDASTDGVQNVIKINLQTHFNIVNNTVILLNKGKMGGVIEEMVRY